MAIQKHINMATHENTEVTMWNAKAMIHGKPEMTIRNVRLMIDNNTKMIQKSIKATIQKNVMMLIRENTEVTIEILKNTWSHNL
ncbi:hypothetical protein KM043_005634 [Ampulex compressa]|nr:hypothetical protein KM043_005634 [Ampulex compressa]